MKKTKELSLKIDKHKERLAKMIKVKKGNLLDKQVVEISKNLDKVLNEYNKCKKGDKKK